jgi:hypothetical protein
MIAFQESVELFDRPHVRARAAASPERFDESTVRGLA